MALVRKLRRFCIFGIILNLWSVDSQTDLEGYRNYCEGYSVKLYCTYIPQKHQLVIEDVIYGTLFDKCGWKSTDSCVVSNASEVINSACAGKTSCTIKVASTNLGTECGTVNNTIRIKVSCVKVSPSTHVILDGWWSSWSAWSACDVTCNGGIKYRSRSCNDPFPANGGNDCQGNSSSTEACNLTSCEEGTTEAPPLTVLDTTDDQCCWCSNMTVSRNLTDEEISIRIKQIEQYLYLDKRKLSSTVRKKNSAEDNRTSSVAIGTVAVVFLTLVTSCIIGLDIERILCRNKTFH